LKEWLAGSLIRGEPAIAGSLDKAPRCRIKKEDIVMTTRVLDRPNRSTQITLLVSIAAGVAIAATVAFAAFGGGGGRNDAPAVPPIANPSPSPSPSPTPPATPVPVPDRTPAPSSDPDDDGSDAMPIKVVLDNATGADVYVDIVDTTGLLRDARSGTPGDGMSVDTLVAENLDATTLKLTWVDFPIDNALALYIDAHEGGVRFLLVQPEPSGTTDAMGVDRELILSFSEPISADDVETLLVEGLDTPG
jgi:uncharacterized membrane protein